jgi:hypothetical protein
MAVFMWLSLPEAFVLLVTNGVVGTWVLYLVSMHSRHRDSGHVSLKRWAVVYVIALVIAAVYSGLYCCRQL